VEEYRRNGAYFAHPDFRLPITSSAIRPRLTHSEAASPEDWLCAAFIGSNRRTANGPVAASPVVKQGRTSYRRISRNEGEQTAEVQLFNRVNNKTRRGSSAIHSRKSAGNNKEVFRSTLTNRALMF
jgi:hypothetical protein